MAANQSFFKQYLPSLFDKIDNTKPLHYKRFLLGLAECGISPNEVDRIFIKQCVGKKRYKVSVKIDAIDDYIQLKKRTLNRDISDRVIAAAKGKSHSKSASGTFCLIHTQEHHYIPFLIMLDNGVPRSLPKLKTKLLLIENFELFLVYKKILQFLNESCNRIVNLTEWDIIYSQGSGILNKQFTPILTNYNVIHCLFDLDFGGLITYFTLCERFKKTVEFIIPTNVETWLDKFGFDIPNSELLQIKNLAKKMVHKKKIKQIINILIKEKLKLEQEVYLI